MRGTLTDFTSPSGKAQHSKDTIRTNLGKPIDRKFPFETVYDEVSYPSIIDPPDTGHSDVDEGA